MGNFSAKENDDGEQLAHLITHMCIDATAV